MIPLIKIRLTYMKRHFIKCFLEYFSFACVVIGILYLIYKEVKYEIPVLSSNDMICDYEQKYPQNETSRRFSREDRVAIVSDDKETIEEFKKFVKNNNFYKINISCFNKKDEMNLGRFDIYIEIIKNNDNYEFKMKSDFIYPTGLSDEENEIISFSDSNKNEVLNEYSFIMHQFLYSIKKPINLKKFGVYSCSFNGTKLLPKKVILLIFVPIFFSYVYGLIFFSFSSRMIYEKEKSLDILLNRYGIKKYQYILSWFLTYIILTSFTTISIIITVCKIIMYKKILLSNFLLSHIYFLV